MPLYNLICYSGNYSKTLGSTMQVSESFKSKIKIKGNTPGNGNTKNIEKAVPLKYLSKFWRTLEIPIISSETNLVLTWSQKCVTSSATEARKFIITYTKLYVPVVTLSTQDNMKLLKQLESGFKIINNKNKYQSKLTGQAQIRYLEYLIDPSFQRVNRLFVLLFGNRADREVHTVYFLPKVEIKDCNVMIDRRNLFNQPIKNDQITYDNIRKIVTGQGGDYTTGCLLDYIYFKEHYKLTAMELNKMLIQKQYKKLILLET